MGEPVVNGVPLQAAKVKGNTAHQQPLPKSPSQPSILHRGFQTFELFDSFSTEPDYIQSLDKIPKDKASTIITHNELFGGESTKDLKFNPDASTWDSIIYNHSRLYFKVRDEMTPHERGQVISNLIYMLALKESLGKFSERYFRVGPDLYLYKGMLLDRKTFLSLETDPNQYENSNPFDSLSLNDTILGLKVIEYYLGDLPEKQYRDLDRLEAPDIKVVIALANERFKGSDPFKLDERFGLKLPRDHIVPFRDLLNGKRNLNLTPPLESQKPYSEMTFEEKDDYWKSVTLYELLKLRELLSSHHHNLGHIYANRGKGGPELTWGLERENAGGPSFYEKTGWVADSIYLRSGFETFSQGDPRQLMRAAMHMLDLQTRDPQRLSLVSVIGGLSDAELLKESAKQLNPNMFQFDFDIVKAVIEASKDKNANPYKSLDDIKINQNEVQAIVAEKGVSKEYAETYLKLKTIFGRHFSGQDPFNFNDPQIYLKVSKEDLDKLSEEEKAIFGFHNMLFSVKKFENDMRRNLVQNTFNACFTGKDIREFIEEVKDTSEGKNSGWIDKIGFFIKGRIGNENVPEKLGKELDELDALMRDFNQLQDPKHTSKLTNEDFLKEYEKRLEAINKKLQEIRSSINEFGLSQEAWASAIIDLSTAVASIVTVLSCGAGSPLLGTTLSAARIGAGTKLLLDFTNEKTRGKEYTFGQAAQATASGGATGAIMALGGAWEQKAVAKIMSSNGLKYLAKRGMISSYVGAGTFGTAGGVNTLIKTGDPLEAFYAAGSGGVTGLWLNPLLGLSFFAGGRVLNYGGKQLTYLESKLAALKPKVPKILLTPLKLPKFNIKNPFSIKAKCPHPIKEKEKFCNEINEQIKKNKEGLEEASKLEEAIVKELREAEKANDAEHVTRCNAMLQQCKKNKEMYEGTIEHLRKVLKSVEKLNAKPNTQAAESPEDEVKALTREPDKYIQKSEEALKVTEDVEERMIADLEKAKASGNTTEVKLLEKLLEDSQNAISSRINSTMKTLQALKQIEEESMERDALLASTTVRAIQKAGSEGDTLAVQALEANLSAAGARLNKSRIMLDAIKTKINKMHAKDLQRDLQRIGRIQYPDEIKARVGTYITRKEGKELLEQLKKRKEELEKARSTTQEAEGVGKTVELAGLKKEISVLESTLDSKNIVVPKNYPEIQGLNGKALDDALDIRSFIDMGLSYIQSGDFEAATTHFTKSNAADLMKQLGIKVNPKIIGFDVAKSFEGQLDGIYKTCKGLSATTTTGLNGRPEIIIDIPLLNVGASQPFTISAAQMQLFNGLYRDVAIMQAKSWAHGYQQFLRGHEIGFINQSGHNFPSTIVSPSSPSGFETNPALDYDALKFLQEGGINLSGKMQELYPDFDIISYLTSGTPVRIHPPRANPAPNAR